MNTSNLAFALLLLAALLVGCNAPSSADSLLRQKIDQKNHIADLISEGADKAELETQKEKLDDIDALLKKKRAAMSKAKWNKLLEKYDKEDRTATGRMLMGVVGIDTRDEKQAEDD